MKMQENSKPTQISPPHVTLSFTQPASLKIKYVSLLYFQKHFHHLKKKHWHENELNMDTTGVYQEVHAQHTILPSFCSRNLRNENA